MIDVDELGDKVIKPLLPLFSTFTEEPAIAEILPLFLKNLPSYLSRLEEALASGEIEAAIRTCHDLKGTAGGYGYPSISAVASNLESALRGGDEDLKAREHLESLRDLFSRALLGLQSLA